MQHKSNDTFRLVVVPQCGIHNALKQFIKAVIDVRNREDMLEFQSESDCSKLYFLPSASVNGERHLDFGSCFGVLTFFIYT